MTERMKQQLVWGCTINVREKPGRNVPMDLHMEHINKHCKQSGKSRVQLSEKSVNRIGKVYWRADASYPQI